MCNLACLTTQLACCCARKAGTSVLCCTAKSSIMVRAYYAAQFVISTILAWALYRFGDQMPHTVTGECDKECWQYLAVARISFAVVMYHVVLCLLTFGIRTSKQVMASVQNGYWAIKVLVWLGAIAGVFYIPDGFYFRYHIAALVFASMFILLQSLLLVDFAWQWAQSWIEKLDETGDEWYKNMLIGLCVLFYSISIAMTIVLYYYFSPLSKSSECGLNAYFITMNLILIVVHSVTAILPRIQESTPKSGLFQSAILAAYTTYLTASALIAQPNAAEFQCNPMVPGNSSGDAVQNSPLSNLMGYIGIFVTFLALGYSAFSGGSTSAFEYRSLEDGSPDDTVDEDNDDETDRTVYNYSFFHFTFVLAAFYMFFILNDWSVMQSDLKSPNGVTVVHAFGAMWVKVVTSWVCVLLYLWTLVAPLIFPERDFN